MLRATSPCPVTPSPTSCLLGGSRSTSCKYLPETVADHRPAQLVISDMARTADALGLAGAPLLPIPGNYYDDLDARLDLERELLSFLRRIGGMYDEDEHGSYIQLFTPVIGSRIFFEISQRLSGYAGYGVINDPVRMAAHRALRLSASPGRPDQHG